MVPESGNHWKTAIARAWRSPAGGDFGTSHSPAIATWIYGFPRQEVAEIAVATVISHLARHQSLELVIFVCFDPATLEAYRKALGEEA